MQAQTIYNLRNQQAAEIQKFDLMLKEKTNSSAQIDLSQALKSVDTINISSINIKAPQPVQREYVDLVKERESDGENEEWMLSVKAFLSDINRKIPRIHLSEIFERLESLRYCSEFDVLNDVLSDVDNANHTKQVKRRFVKHFGNLSQWTFERLIKWCECNNLYQICQKIRKNKIDGKTFLNLFTNMSTVRQFFSNLTSPQLVSLYGKVNGYFDDSMSIL